MAHYIAICGIDGSGKTTLANALKERLAEIGTVCITKIKLNSLKVLAEVMKKENNPPYSFYDNIPPEIIRYGIAMDFAIHYMDKKNELAPYDYVICDRYYPCFQAYGLAYGVKDMSLPNKLFHLSQEPLLYIHTDVPVEVAHSRLTTRGDYIEEEENIELLSKVKYYYSKLLDGKNVLLVDGEIPIHSITKDAYERIIHDVKKIKHRSLGYE